MAKPKDTSEPSTEADAFEARREAVYAWAMRIVGNHHDALDVTQDVSLRWLNRAAGEREKTTNPTGWLRRVAVNRAIDLIRSRKAATKAAAHVQPFAAQATSVADQPPEQAQAAELRAVVAQAIAHLSDSQQRVLLAKVFEGQTFAQIADEMAIAVPTAKTHFLRAIQSVRDALRPYYFDRLATHPASAAAARERLVRTSLADQPRPSSESKP